MKITKKLKNKILQVIDDFFVNELKDIMLDEYPPEYWSEDEKRKVNAFLCSSNVLQEKIKEVME